MMKMVYIKLIEGGKLPEYKTKGSAGADCYSRIKWELKPGDRMRIPLGFAVELPFGYEMQIRPRSGLTNNKIDAYFGTIDSDYRGEVCAIIQNNSEEDFMIEKGDRICQAVIAQVEDITFIECDVLSETERGSGGFGSTGI